MQDLKKTRHNDLLGQNDHRWRRAVPQSLREHLALSQVREPRGTSIVGRFQRHLAL